MTVCCGPLNTPALCGLLSLPLAPPQVSELPPPVAAAPPPAPRRTGTTPVAQISSNSLAKRNDSETPGDVRMAQWGGGQMAVAVKSTGVSCSNAAAVDSERKLLEVLQQSPHKNVLVVYGICTDAPDGSMRLVMAFCSGGGLEKYLQGFRASGTVRVGAPRRVWCVWPVVCCVLRCFSLGRDALSLLVSGSGCAGGGV